jgi:uncharacterized protein (DUF169 family)
MRGAAQRLKDALGLESMPVGVAFTDTPPEGVPHAGASVAAGCGFWREAAHSVFWTAAGDHAGCPIGTLTMGFEPSPDQQAEAGRLVGEMEALGYLAPGEAGALPMVPGPTRCITYGPLDEFPIDPDAVLVIARADQMMVLGEATGAVHLGAGGLPLYGRPACSAIPRAISGGGPTASLGCAGMRTFTAVDPGMLLLVVPGGSFPELAERAVALADANTSMRAFYAERAGAVARD